LVQINKDGGYLSQVKSRGPAANSDHYFFTEKGVPAFFIYTMGPNKNYHDVFDQYEALSFAAFEPLAKLLYEFLNSF
jgi:Zn-dependent M28 family amino/carboxypeptidase